MACTRDLFNIGRGKAAVIHGILMVILSMPCVLGYNVWSAFQHLGAGSTVLDLEDFIVRNFLLPLGSLVYLLFCVSRVGWGFENYRAEANAGEGVKKLCIRDSIWKAFIWR